MSAHHARMNNMNKPPVVLKRKKHHKEQRKQQIHKKRLVDLQPASKEVPAADEATSMVIRGTGVVDAREPLVRVRLPKINRLS
jgi:hypothetical protein